ncbi:MAG TPA: DUF3810 domain-containing protein [Chitinophagaceae bacterium]|nr:DUF3810 domain-containing protein [Chitinophagaceae bacterium]
MFKSSRQDKILLVLVILVLLIRLFSMNEGLVEKYYTYGFYPVISEFLRLLFGFLPFSFGDLLYVAAIIYIVAKGWKLARQIRRKTVRRSLPAFLKKLVSIALAIYIVFNIFWGLNYDRQGISYQLGLEVKPYTLTDLDTITNLLQQKLNGTAVLLEPTQREKLNSNRTLAREGVAAFVIAGKKYTFLQYENPSIKPSLFSHIGHFFGFTGYYNPFSGEAQIKTTVPFFLKPFVLTHEIGHQLGYAKENEANFVSFFACRSSANAEFRYSVYYEMYQYAIRELTKRDSVLARNYKDKLLPQVKRDNEEFRRYLERSANPIEPFVSAFYGGYLRMNNQPKGKDTYDEVVAWLIAYQKKYGPGSI